MSSSPMFRFHVRITSETLERTKVETVFKSIAKKWIFQEERGIEAKKRHFQGRLSLKVKVRAGTLANDLRSEFNCKDLNVSIEHSDSSFYCIKKDETYVDGPWADHPIYLGKDVACMKSPLGWQQAILDWIEQEPNDRSIVWIYNAGGCIGKSKLVKYCCYNKLATRIPLGKAHQIKTSAIAKGAQRCYLLDIPRVTGSEESQRDLMSAIEEIKNGFVEACMYGKNDIMFMEPPHVFVFSNDIPNIEMCSKDRWEVFELVGKHSQLRRMKMSELIKPKKDKPERPKFDEAKWMQRQKIEF